jgi:hypothetical protein
MSVSASGGVNSQQRTPRIVTLETELLQVAVLPDKGCDIYELRDVASGIDVLAKTRLGLSDLQPFGYASNSAEAWLSQYLGGWQLVLPNGGAPAQVNGAEWGFHGEACVLGWNVDELSATAMTASVRLLRAPLFVRRRLEVSGSTLIVRESVTNESASPIDVMWTHHPAFGAPFLDGGCTVSTGAKTITADDETPGTVLAAGSVHTWPSAQGSDGAVVRLDEVAEAGSGVAHLAYLSEFESGFFAITNPRPRLGVAFRWPTDVFPCAWYWVEAGASKGFPWHGSHYSFAIEPATSAPGQGIGNLRAKGGTPMTLAPDEEREVELEVTLFHDDRRVVGVDAGGAVEFFIGSEMSR